MAEAKMLLETTDAVTVSESSACGISVLKNNFVIKPLSMSHVKEVREALLAKQLFDNDGLENANSSVVSYTIRFDPEKGQDINAHPGKMMGKLKALEVPSFTHDAAASEITDQIKIK